MSNEIVLNGVQSNQIVNLTATDIEALSKAGILPKDTPSEQVAIFRAICNEKGLSPYSKQIYLIERNDAKKGKVYTTQTGIDGFRALAERTGKYAGSTDPIFNDTFTQYECINQKIKPITASITVKKIVGGFVCDFTATATWDAYFPKFNGFMWDKMPYLMLSKCAESLALRKAFPDALSGIYTNEEMQQADYVLIEEKPKDTLLIQLDEANSLEDFNAILFKWLNDKSINKDKLKDFNKKLNEKATSYNLVFDKDLKLFVGM